MLLRIASLVLLTGCLQAAEPGRPAAAPVGFNPTLSLAPLVDSVQPAVVTVYVSSRIKLDPRLQWWGFPSEQVVEGQGSGFVVSADGYILTNRHVAQNASDIKVKFPDGLDVPAKVVGVDDLSDVALLKIDAGRPLPYLKLSDNGHRVGDWVIAVGNPLGLGHTVTSGIISGVGRNIPGAPLEEFLQTDAAINQGNSGGPLIAMDGSVVGMNTAIIQGANTVGFAIPSDHLATVMEQLRKHGKVARGYLGVEMATIPEVAQKALGGKGVLLEGVAVEGPAGKAGIKPGDLVTRVDDRAVVDAQELLRAISAHSPGEKVTLTVLREGKEKKFDVTLAERPKEVIRR